MLVKAVARNRGMSESAIRDTEAARYLGDEAIPVGLADRMGTKAAVLSDLRQAVAWPTISIPRGGKKVMASEYGWYRGWYHVGVSNARKLIAKMRRNPRDWRIEDLKVVADSLGINHDQHGTSHVVFRHANAGRLSVPAHRPSSLCTCGCLWT